MEDGVGNIPGDHRRGKVCRLVKKRASDHEIRDAVDAAWIVLARDGLTEGRWDDERWKVFEPKWVAMAECLLRGPPDDSIEGQTLHYVKSIRIIEARRQHSRDDVIQDLHQRLLRGPRSVDEPQIRAALFGITRDGYRREGRERARVRRLANAVPPPSPPTAASDPAIRMWAEELPGELRQLGADVELVTVLLALGRGETYVEIAALTSAEPDRRREADRLRRRVQRFARRTPALADLLHRRLRDAS